MESLPVALLCSSCGAETFAAAGICISCYLKAASETSDIANTIWKTVDGRSVPGVQSSPPCFSADAFQDPAVDPWNTARCKHDGQSNSTAAEVSPALSSTASAEPALQRSHTDNVHHHPFPQSRAPCTSRPDEDDFAAQTTFPEPARLQPQYNDQNFPLPQTGMPCTDRPSEDEAAAPPAEPAFRECRRQ